jgi:hypothetical protein
VRTKPKISSTAPEPFESDPKVGALARIGRALALSIGLNSELLEPCDADEALQMLVAIYCFFTLAREEKAAGRDLLLVILDLQEAAVTLCELYPGLRSRVVPITHEDTEGVITYVGCPF